MQGETKTCWHLPGPDAARACLFLGVGQARVRGGAGADLWAAGPWSGGGGPLSAIPPCRSRMPGAASRGESRRAGYECGRGVSELLLAVSRG